jgi:Flp pilus assembly protein TadD
LTRAFAIGPAGAAAHFGRGNALAGLKRPEDALGAYDAALALMPYDARILNNRGTVLARMSRHEDAVDSFKRAITADPNDAEACKNLGDALIHLKRPGEALASYDQALGARAGYAEALYGRAHALSELKRDDEAIAAYRQLLNVRPDHPYGQGMLLHAKQTACDWRDRALVVADIVQGVRDGRNVVTPLAFLAVSDSEKDNTQCARILMSDRFKPSSEPLWRVVSAIVTIASGSLTSRPISARTRSRRRSRACSSGMIDAVRADRALSRTQRPELNAGTSGTRVRPLHRCGKPERSRGRIRDPGDGGGYRRRSHRTDSPQPTGNPGAPPSGTAGSVSRICRIAGRGLCRLCHRR